MIKGVEVSHLKIIDTPGGNVMHAMKKSSLGYVGFGEAYFSQIHKGAIKGWKRHSQMTLNIIVPIGSIRFVLINDFYKTNSNFQEVIISQDNYCRLTIPPMIWMGFQGINDESLLLNIADIEHDPSEVETRDLNEIDFNWSK